MQSFHHLFPISESKNCSRHWQSQGKQLLVHHRSFPIAYNVHVQYPSLCKTLTYGHIHQEHFLGFLRFCKPILTLQSLAQPYQLQLPTPVPATALAAF